jgi:hypothetical protein
MPAVESLDFRSFARRFSPNGGMPPSELLTTLRKQRKDLNPTGWMLIECHMVDSSRFGDRMVIAHRPTGPFVFFGELSRLRAYLL